MSKFSIPSPHPNLSRNGFDLSSRRIFSAPAGALLPVGAWECNPSEHFEISVQDLVRTQSLNTAAFARCKEYYHFFFVPYKALWMYSDLFFTGVKNIESTAHRGATSSDSNYGWVPKKMPNFNLGKLLGLLGANQGLSLDASKDPLGYPMRDGASRLLNLLEYGVGPDLMINSGYTFNKETINLTFTNTADAYKSLQGVTPNLMRLLAYQRIYNDFYRNDQWEQPDVESFNVDFIHSDNQYTVPEQIALKACTLRYRQWSKDWLTSALPTPNYSDGIFNLPSYQGGETLVERGKLSTSIESGGSISVQDIRAAFALDKMLEATRRANGLDYSNQIAAHYGFKVPESRRNNAQFIGGFDNAISISEVVSTQFSENQYKESFAGDVYGKGIGAMNSGKIEFDAKEHGVIMCIYSVLPQTDFNALSLCSFNRKLEREDYYQPEFQNLGYDVITGYDVSLQSQKSLDDAMTVNNVVYGYTPRYAEYKTAKDLVFGEFMTSRQFSAWTTPRIDIFSSTPKILKGGVQKPDNFLSAASLMCDPRVMNPIFRIQYEGKQSTDHFLINSFFDVKAVRPMSVYGLSSL